MRIAPPADDAHLELLKRRNRSDAAVPVAQQVDPVARAEDMTTEETSRQVERPPVERRQGGDRRQADRRRDERNVLLDTRTPQERRTRLRRADDRARLAAETDEPPADETDENPASPRRGIDVFA